jgi:hypothetical protein
MNMFGVSEFLQDYPGMSFGPIKKQGFSLVGTFSFLAHFPGLPSIEDNYKLEIVIPEKFPFELPEVLEKEGKIPRNNEFHINPDDTLCVASPLRVSIGLADTPTICSYAKKFLVPYLYAVSHKLKFGGEFVFGELEHGRKGLARDYADLLGVNDPIKIIPTLQLLCMKKRVANKKACPCGCLRPLGKCEFRYKIEEMRNVAPRSYYRWHLLNLLGT